MNRWPQKAIFETYVWVLEIIQAVRRHISRPDIPSPVLPIDLPEFSVRSTI
jgi:hypothetical protein